MSASERLKALEPHLAGTDERLGMDALFALGDALPQIVAVTSAAEKLYAEAATSAPLWNEINDALIELDKALQ